MADGAFDVAEADGVAVGAKVAIALRPEKLRIAAAVTAADEANTVRGRVWDIGYLGDKSVYKIRLADGSEMKASVANVTRIVERPISWDDEVLLSWSPVGRRAADEVKASAMPAPAPPPPRSSIGEARGAAPYLWLIAFFLVPFLIVLKISLSQTTIAQPPYLPVFDPAAGWQGIKDFFGGLSLENYASSGRRPLYLLSYLHSLTWRRCRPRSCCCRLSDRLCDRTRAAPPAGAYWCCWSCCRSGPRF